MRYSVPLVYTLLSRGPFIKQIFSKRMSSSSSTKSFETLRFDNLALRTLPIDPETENSIREVRGACFSKIDPTPLKNPQLVVYSSSAMKLIDLDKDQLERKEAAEYFGGNTKLPGSETAAHCYCGHQFGSFAGQLGDGAAIYLGEVLNNDGKRWEIQLKGAGLTPYSRMADGRKVLRSSLREFMCSEAMHFLGVPTTRAGTCVVSDSTVIRDIFYDGNPKLERCAVVLRIAQTFIRFGSFEIFIGRDRLTSGRGPSYGRIDIMTKLMDYVCDTFYPEIANSSTERKEVYEKVFEEIVKRTARLVALWQCYGFVHGVLNTDNMSIYGLTIDYGPFGFLDRYDPDFIFNSSDHTGRYTYRNQPRICEWNCVKLAEAISPILDIQNSKRIIQETFESEFKKTYLAKMRAKLGLTIEREEDEKLIDDLFSVMYETGSDFTNTFRKLSLFELNGQISIDNDIQKFLDIILAECSTVDEYISFFKPKFPKEALDKLLKAMEEEPGILNYFGLSERSVRNDVVFAEKHARIKDFTSEDKRRVDSEQWSKWLRVYAQRVYDHEPEQALKSRASLMNSNNPRFTLRNHVIQGSIEAAEANKFDEARMYLRVLENCFSDEPLSTILAEFDNKKVAEKMESQFYERPPAPSKCVKLSCSS